MFFNFPLVTAFLSMSLAQLIKLPIHYFLHKEWCPSIILSTGGMPSSHSAFVTSLVISMGIEYGVDSGYFAISFVLAGIVIHDALGIRREAGKHATVLNKMGQDIDFLIKSIKKHEYDKNTYNKKFKELLGHEPLEALSGVVFGVVITFISFYLNIL